MPMTHLPLRHARPLAVLIDSQPVSSSRRAELGDNVYSTPAQARGEKLGNGHFLRAHAGDGMIFAVAIPPRLDDEGDL